MILVSPSIFNLRGGGNTRSSLQLFCRHVRSIVASSSIRMKPRQFICTRVANKFLSKLSSLFFLQGKRKISEEFVILLIKYAI